MQASDNLLLCREELLFADSVEGCLVEAADRAVYFGILRLPDSAGYSGVEYIIKVLQH